MQEDIIDQLAECLANKVAARIPVDIALWDIKTCADYLNLSVTSFRQRFACLPDFPGAVRLPSPSGQKAHPLYEAQEVIAWAMKYKEKRKI
ncbi:hypothetical protein ACO0LM_12090 [Undibacterium sp. Di26W]|uniref:hypothetical protein n=1 Tax=Undibacterium sp. Di26W TaxID=3413035 RepID=UPI003BF32B4F